MSDLTFARRFEIALGLQGYKHMWYFSFRSGVKRQIIDDLLTGKLPMPDNDTFDRISRKFHVCPEWLKTGEGEPYQHEMRYDYVQCPHCSNDVKIRARD